MYGAGFLKIDLSGTSERVFRKPHFLRYARNPPQVCPESSSGMPRIFLRYAVPRFLRYEDFVPRDITL